MKFIHFLLRLAINVLSGLRTFFINVYCKLTPRVTSINILGRYKIKFDTSSEDGLIKTLLNPDKTFESNELKLFSVLAEKADIVLDLGANIGVYSLLASTINPRSEVIAFEPNPINYKKLKHNLELNRISNVLAEQKAVGQANTTISFTIAKSGSTSVSSVNPDFVKGWHADIVEIKAEQCSLDSYFNSRKDSKTVLVKLDVEYYEMEVLKGAADFIRRFQPAFLCEVNIYEIIVHYLPNMNGKIDKNLSFEIEAFFKNNNYFIYTLGEDGVMRIDTVHNHPDVRNFLFSSFRTEKLFTPYSEKEEIFKLLKS